MINPESFEEFWKKSPRLEGVDAMDIGHRLVLVIAKTCYIAGQSSMRGWLQQELKNRGL